MTHQTINDLSSAELRAEGAFIRRRLRALEQVERAIDRASRALHAAGDRDMADMLFIGWCSGDAALMEAREYLSTLDRAADRGLNGAEPARPVMQAAA